MSMVRVHLGSPFKGTYMKDNEPCEFCEVNCNNPWCPTNKENSNDKELDEQGSES